MILFLSDFGHAGPYVGQVHAVLARSAPGVPVIDLMHDLPAFRPAAAGCLIHAILRSMAPPDPTPGTGGGDIVLAVVDPGVGTGRDPIIIEIGGTRYIGPDNGLFARVAASRPSKARRIDWRPDRLSDSFHGRDLFAPVAGMLAMGRPVASSPVAFADLVVPAGPDRTAEIVHCDRYGNALTGIDAADLADDSVLHAGEGRFRRARVFAEVPVGAGFWYCNSLGLAEIAVNQGDAAALFGLTVGTPVATGA